MSDGHGSYERTKALEEGVGNLIEDLDAANVRIWHLEHLLRVGIRLDDGGRGWKLWSEEARHLLEQGSVANQPAVCEEDAS